MSIPQMRSAPTIGSRGLSATWTTLDSAAVVSLRGAVDTDNIGVMLTAIDAVLAAPVPAVLLDCDLVASWSVRGLEVAVHTAVRATELRRLFAMSGLDQPQRELIRRNWPGVPLEPFGYPTADKALRALTAEITVS